MYQRDTALTDLTFTAQVCSNLGDWKSPGEAAGFSDEVIWARAVVAACAFAAIGLGIQATRISRT